jgi:hypothetical protein
MTVLLWTLWTAQASIWFYFSTRLSISQDANTSRYTGRCENVNGIPSWTWIMYLCTAMFDVLILILTLQSQIDKLKDILFPSMTTSSPIDNSNDNSGVTLRRTGRTIPQLFFLDTLMYFAISVTVALIISGWIFHHRQDQFYTVLMSPV